MDVFAGWVVFFGFIAIPLVVLYLAVRAFLKFFFTAVIGDDDEDIKL